MLFRSARLRQVVHIAHKLGRKVAVAGRSMDQNLKVAAEIGYLGAPEGTLIDLRESNNIPPSKLVVLATGSQGEPTSVLSRMAMGDHPNVRIIEQDTVIFSAGPIPGNEETVARAIDNLYRRGAKVIYRAINEDTSPHSVRAFPEGDRPWARSPGIVDPLFLAPGDTVSWIINVPDTAAPGVVHVQIGRAHV